MTNDVPVTEELRRVVQTIEEAITHVEQASQLLEEVITDLSAALAGSNNSEVVVLLTMFHEIHRDTHDLLRQFDGACASASGIFQRVSSLLGSIGVPAGQSSSGTSSARRPEPHQQAAVHERHAEKVQSFRDETGRGVERRRATGAWLDENGGLEQLRSGERTDSGLPDPWFQKADELAWTLRLKPSPRHVFALASHVEIKFATRLRSMPWVRMATVLIDRPCAAPPRPPAPGASPARNCFRSSYRLASCLRWSTSTVASTSIEEGNED